MIGRPSPETLTAEQTRIGRQWSLFAEKYSDFCIHHFEKYRPEGIFVEDSSDTANAERQAEAKLYHDEIIALDDAELDARWIEQQRAEAARREAEHPLNAALATSAVYDFYSKASYWGLDEGVALLLERDPKGLNSESVKKYRPPPRVGQQFIELADLARRASKMLQLPYQSAPGIFLAWAKRNRIPVPEALEQAVVDHGHQVADWKTLYDQQGDVIAELQAAISELTATSLTRPTDKPLHERERSSLLKLVIGMAIKGYGHDPVASRTSTAREIASDLQLIGLTLDEDTIRKYLAEGRETLPE